MAPSRVSFSRRPQVSTHASDWAPSPTRESAQTPRAHGARSSACAAHAPLRPPLTAPLDAHCMQIQQTIIENMNVNGAVIDGSAAMEDLTGAFVLSVFLGPTGRAARAFPCTPP